MSDASGLLLDFCQHLQIDPPLHGPESGAVGIDYGNGLMLFVAGHGDTLLIYSRVGEVAVDQPEMLEVLLEANLFGQQTGGATLALERFSRAVVLQQSMEAHGLDVRSLEARISSFLDQAERWTAALLALAQAEPDGQILPSMAQPV